MTVKKETYINTLVDSMSMEDLQQYVANDMASWLYHVNDTDLLNEFLILESYLYNDNILQPQRHGHTHT